jgi:hypothetical protein
LTISLAFMPPPSQTRHIATPTVREIPNGRNVRGMLPPHPSARQILLAFRPRCEPAAELEPRLTRDMRWTETSDGCQSSDEAWRRPMRRRQIHLDALERWAISRRASQYQELSMNTGRVAEYRRRFHVTQRERVRDRLPAFSVKSMMTSTDRRLIIVNYCRPGWTGGTY